MSDSFQVHVFGDPGMEMMPECNGCMCYKHSKKLCFLNDFTFSFMHEIGVLRDGFGCHFGMFWWPWTLFLIFEGLGDRLEI